MTETNCIVHTNDWGTYTEDIIILEYGLAVCQLSFPGKDDPPYQRKRAWLHDLSVLPEVRGHGLATRLIEICKQRTLAAGRRMLSLWVKPGSWQEQWYIRLGFVRDEYFERDDGNNVYNLMLDSEQTK